MASPKGRRPLSSGAVEDEIVDRARAEIRGFLTLGISDGSSSSGASSICNGLGSTVVDRNHTLLGQHPQQRIGERRDRDPAARILAAEAQAATLVDPGPRADDEPVHVLVDHNVTLEEAAVT